MFSDKLIQLRREKGYSQEQLAGLLSVSRQSVSKWESGGAMPELNKLITLSDLFGVSLDELVRDGACPPPPQPEIQPSYGADSTAVLEELVEIKKMVNRSRGYEFKSQTRLFGLPLVHVRFSAGENRPGVAKGIIAVGNIAIGVFSLGGISLGLVSLGGLSFGLALGLGGLAIGACALGGVAAGFFAAGGVALGVYAVGGVAVASELAAGSAAQGRVAIGEAVSGEQALSVASASTEEIFHFIQKHCPRLWRGIARMIANLY